MLRDSEPNLTIDTSGGAEGGPMRKINPSPFSPGHGLIGDPRGSPPSPVIEPLEQIGVFARTDVSDGEVVEDAENRLYTASQKIDPSPCSAASRSLL
jgi:hypothetical protein